MTGESLLIGMCIGQIALWGLSLLVALYSAYLAFSDKGE